MGRAQGVCRLCPDRRRQGRNRAHRDDPVQQCAACGDRVCGRHVAWDSASEQWVCTRCLSAGRPVERSAEAPPTLIPAVEAAALDRCQRPGCPKLAVAHGYCIPDQRLRRLAPP